MTVLFGIQVITSLSEYISPKNAMLERSEKISVSLITCLTKTLFPLQKVGLKVGKQTNLCKDFFILIDRPGYSIRMLPKL